MTWFVAYTDSRCERETCEDIHELGYQAFTPIERHKKFRQGLKIIQETALFPRYLFVSFSAEDPHWTEILECDGVCDILRNNGQPSPVPCGLTEKLMRMQLRGLFDFTKAPNPFPPNTTVLLDDDGPFSDLEAKVLRVRSRDRVDVILQYLGREMMVNVPMARLSHI